jgi:hypothetical protein
VIFENAIDRPAAIELISVAILFDLLREEGAIMQKTNVSHGGSKMDKLVRRRVTYVRHLRSLYRG